MTVLEARRDALHRTGKWLDSLGYALFADEWPIKPRFSSTAP